MKWQDTHNRKYTEEETGYRYEIFKANHKFVTEHNARYEKGLETHTVELNKFADLDGKEFKKMYTGFKRDPKVTKECKGKIDIVSNPPASISWKDSAVAPVKDQGMCGSCWAFSACGALEGLYAIQNKQILNFAPQQLVDCAGGEY